MFIANEAWASTPGPSAGNTSFVVNSSNDTFTTTPSYGDTFSSPSVNGEPAGANSGATTGEFPLREALLAASFAAGDVSAFSTRPYPNPNISTYTITFTSDVSSPINLKNAPPMIFGNVTIDGSGASGGRVIIDGSQQTGVTRGLFISALNVNADGSIPAGATPINVNIKNVTFQNCAAKGGNSNQGGAGMGAGGAIFIGPNANVTLDGVIFSGNSVTGGTGGASSATYGGAGGGLGGGGGSGGGGGITGSTGVAAADGTGGGGGIGADGGLGYGTVGTTTYAGGGGGGFGGEGTGQVLPKQFAGTGGPGFNATNVGANGGGGTGSYNTAYAGSGDTTGLGTDGTATGGGGGGGGIDGTPVYAATSNNGGDGGFGGGGGGSGYNGYGAGASGAGGFGGGSGGANLHAGSGGFGGGGGYQCSGGFGGGAGNAGLSSGFGAGGNAYPGTAGFGGGNGAGTPAGLSGGGAGMGGAVFVYGSPSSSSPATLTIKGSGSLSNSSATGGTGANNGSAYGNGFFLYGYGTLDFDTNGTQTYSDDIADQLGSGDTISSVIGSWGLTKSGSGTLILSGTNTYAGDTAINQGILSVNGSIASKVYVNSSGFLKGTGTINNDVTVSGGTIAPGNSIGTLTINGNLNLQGGTYDAEIDANGTHDLINVSNTATLTNGTLNVILSGSQLPAATQTYTILTAGAIAGTFGTLASSSGLLYDITYTTTSVTISNITNGYAASLPPGSTYNEIQAANLFTSIYQTSPSGDIQTILNDLRSYVISNNSSALQNSFNQLQPSQLTGSRIAAFTAIQAVSQTADNQISFLHFLHERKLKTIRASRSKFIQLVQKTRQLDANFKEMMAKFSTPSGVKAVGSLRNIGIPVSQRIKIGKGNIWFQGIGLIQNMRSSSASPGFTNRTGGFAFGVDRSVAQKAYIGAFAGYTDSPLDWKQGRGHGSVKTYSGGIYGAKVFNNDFFLSGQLMGGREDYRATRYITLPVTRNANSHHHGSHFFTQFEAGKAFTVSRLQIQPFLNVSYLYLYEKPFTENGADSIDYSIRSHHSNFLRSEAGIRFYNTFEKHGALVRPELSLSYVNLSQFGGGRGHIKSSLVGFPDYAKIFKGYTGTISQVAPALSLTAQMKNGFYFIANVRGEIGEKLKSFTALVSVGRSF